MQYPGELDIQKGRGELKMDKFGNRTNTFDKGFRPQFNLVAQV